MEQTPEEWKREKREAVVAAAGLRECERIVQQFRKQVGSDKPQSAQPKANQKRNNTPCH